LQPIVATWANQKNAAELLKWQNIAADLQAKREHETSHLNAQITLLKAEIMKLQNDNSFLETELSSLLKKFEI